MGLDQGGGRSGTPNGGFAAPYAQQAPYAMQQAPVAAPAAAQAAAPAAATAQDGAAPDDANERELFELINQVRRQLGLNPLVYDASLAPTARRSAAARQHTGAPEIIAWGQQTPAQAIETWRNSPPHWNLLTSPNFTAMGPGWVGDGAGVMFR